MTNHLSRRAFMAGAAATAVAASPITEGGLSRTPQVCVFSKHLQFITDYDELARTYKDLGLDGVDLTVRSGGHVLPEHVARDLPRAVRAFRSTGLGVPMITTRLNRGDDPNARPILETAAREGIQYFRVGGLKYADAGNPLDQLPEFTESLRSLAQLAGDLGMIAGYHNHSGTNQVGAPLWGPAPHHRDCRPPKFRIQLRRGPRHHRRRVRCMAHQRPAPSAPRQDDGRQGFRVERRPCRMGATWAGLGEDNGIPPHLPRGGVRRPHLDPCRIQNALPRRPARRPSRREPDPPRLPCRRGIWIINSFACNTMAGTKNRREEVYARICLSLVAVPCHLIHRHGRCRCPGVR